jgi:phenylpyruvate tautomerase PptA (4-oxalocrotonate tautomerase family)
MELRALIIQACSEITEDMCRRVINSITVHVEEVARHNGGHIEHLIHRG